ncbi:MAG: DUF1565 domain-containing protein, partial [Desulfobulbaceae bacterium]|nr:DUF1565 domain-containing protein [Desulfobulbaceae bacterium]
MKNQHVFKVLAVFFVIGTAVLWAGEKAFCATHRVSTQFPSIQKALDASVEGDKVQVAQGTYFEHITLKKGVVLEGGWNKGFSQRDIASFETMIDGIKEKGPVVTCADNATLDGFTIIHGSLLKTDDISHGSGIYCKGVSSLIVNNTVRENEPSGMFFEGGSSVISKNLIFNNAQAGIYA